MHIDCDCCVMQGTAACDGCLVTFLLDRPEGAIVFDVEEERALRTLSGAGLAAEVRFDAGEAPPGVLPA